MYHPELKEELRKQRKEEEAATLAALGNEELEEKKRTGHERAIILRDMALKVESLTGRKKMKKEFIPDPEARRSKCNSSLLRKPFFLTNTVSRNYIEGSLYWDRSDSSRSDSSSTGKKKVF